MASKKNIKLELTTEERVKLKASKIKISEIVNYSLDELCVILNAPLSRVRELLALAEFQTIPSIGIRFAQDLISLGYYCIEQLKGKNGALLANELENLKGYWVDPCVEDQFRLIVYYAETRDASKNWWCFTPERKAYRIENGYSANRPTKAWHEDMH
jgi:hypothetical protein